MVKVFYLGLFAAIVCAIAVSYATAGPVPVPTTTNIRQHPLLQHHQENVCNGSHCQTQQRIHQQRNQHQHQEVAYADDGTVRSERSTNLSHITGSARKIQMFVKNWHLQILPDGVVNGTQDDSSDYTILQRTTVNIGQLKIQGVATCQYLCMDSCGLLYASAIVSHRLSPLANTNNIHGHRIRMNMKNLKWNTEKDFVDECIFNEMIEQHHYNTYSSVRYSNARRTMYIALNRWGQPRRVQIRAKQQLGKLSTYARVLTKTISLERVEDLLKRIGNITGSHPLRHHGGLQTCTAVVEQKTLNNDEWQGVDKLRCRKRKKRKKKRRRCQQNGDTSDGCPPINKNKNNNKGGGDKNNNNKGGGDKNKQCEHDNNSKRCQRLGGKKSELVTVNKRKKKQQKQLNNNNNNNNNAKKRNNQKTLLRNNSNRNIVKKVLVDDVVVIENDNVTITSASVEESSVMDELTTMTSAMEDSEQNYDDSGSVASSTLPSGEVD